MRCWAILWRLPSFRLHRKRCSTTVGFKLNRCHGMKKCFRGHAILYTVVRNAAKHVASANFAMLPRQVGVPVVGRSFHLDEAVPDSC